MISNTDKLTPAEYHADPRVTASQLAVFRRSKRLYYERYIAKSLPQDTSPRLELGSAIHTRVLEPDRFATDVAVAPLVDRRTVKGRETFAAFESEARAAGKIIIDAKQAATVEAVAKAISEVPLARFLVNASGPVEEPVFWTDETTGLECKCRPDKRLTSQATVIDLKSSSDGSEWAFQKALMAFNYAQASRHYSAGCEAERFVWLVVDIEPPHEVHLYELDQRSVEAAEQRYRAVLCELAAAIETGDWGLTPQAIQPLSLPAWAMPKPETRLESVSERGI